MVKGFKSYQPSNIQIDMMTTQTTTSGLCTKCGNDTGAAWKTLCRLCWEKRTPDEVRAQRQAKLDKKVAQMRDKAERLEKEADSKLALMDQYRGDIAFLTQPAAPGSTFGRQRAKVYARYDKGMEFSAEAGKLKKEADWKEKRGVSVRGDAEAQRQLEREKRDKVFTVGSKVYDWIFGDGEIIKVNRKTYTIKFASDGTYARDKSYIKL
jgi:hypothetical protein